jgi:hypothetical protein
VLGVSEDAEMPMIVETLYKTFDLKNYEMKKDVCERK